MDNLAAVANCNAVVFNLLPSDLGSVEFSGGGMTAGCNPCVETCDFVVVPDTSPPSAIVLSLADRSTNYLRVRWPAPDEDGPNGYGRRCQGYDLRRSTLPLTEANFAAAFPITNVPTPNGPGVVQETNIYSLQHGTTYYVAIRAVDDAQNWGALSNVLVATTLPAPDTTPPAAVTTLTITDVTASSFLMAWNAPGDDGTVGQAAEYDLRYSPAPITSANFGAADAATGEPLPGPSGTLETFALTGLSEGTRFYAALRTRDEVPLWSGLSNVATAVTLATGPPDTIPPAAVIDLGVTAADINYAALEWTVPGDDSLSGRAVVYDMRRSALPITAANFVAATAVVGEPVPGLPGARQGMTVSGLTSGVRYYFALKTGDEVPNWSPLSNVVNQLTHQSNSNARLMLHVAAPTTKSPCVSGQLANCRDAVTRGDLAPIGGTGPWYFVYLLATRFTELGGLQCGIDYDQGRSDGDANLQGIDVFGWTLCATLEFPTPGTRSWPKPGSGNSLTWDTANRCQTGATAVGGFFYLAAYSADILKIIPRPIDGVARVANCGATQNLVLDEYLGTARFSFGGAIAGYNPCDASQSVGVERTTWSRIKTLVGR